MPPKPRKPPPRRPDPRKRNLLIAGAGAVAVVAILVVVSVVVAGGGDSGTTTTSGASSSALFAGIPQSGTELGSKSAPVTFIQFEDLQCPICRSYQEDGFSGIVQDYVRTGKVRLRFAGVAFLGQDSEKALAYALAAGKQGKLWQYVAALYANQGEENSGWVTDELLERLAKDVGLDWRTPPEGRGEPGDRPAGQGDRRRGGPARRAGHADLLRQGRRRPAVRRAAELVLDRRLPSDLRRRALAVRL